MHPQHSGLLFSTASSPNCRYPCLLPLSRHFLSLPDRSTPPSRRPPAEKGRGACAPAERGAGRDGSGLPDAGGTDTRGEVARDPLHTGGGGDLWHRVRSSGKTCQTLHSSVQISLSGCHPHAARPDPWRIRGSGGFAATPYATPVRPHWRYSGRVRAAAPLPHPGRPGDAATPAGTAPFSGFTLTARFPRPPERAATEHGGNMH